ncbi:MAG: hypothetical protein IT368_15310 [Candidatus Hydrogenedentes bacterium]|nr:hypothetical protein [Candidatus Hydrogenedentota bacterium]
MAPASDAPDPVWEVAATAPAAQAGAPQAPAAESVQLTQNAGAGSRVAAFWFILPNR